MPENKIAENVLGTLGAICWTIQLVPQIWKSWRTKSTEGLSSWLMLLWAISGAFLGVYAVVQNLNIPLILQPQLFTSLALVSWGQCQYYGRGKTTMKSVALIIASAAILGGFETGMTFVVKNSPPHTRKELLQFFSIASSILLSVALFPQYYEIYKHREVIGISLTFMAIDLLGGLFSILSLAFKRSFDIFASIAYSCVVVLDGVVLLAAAILNPRARRRRIQARNTQNV